MKAFIFDFDGVIVDSELHWDKHALSTYQEIIPEFTEEHNKDLKGRNAHDIYEMLKNDFQVRFSKEEYLAHLKKLTDRIYGELTKVLPGVLDLVTLLHQWNIQTPIASSGEREWIDRALARLQMQHLFSPIVTAADVGIGKPDPAIYLQTLKYVKCPASDCVALEDSTNGVRSAKKAGIFCIGLHHAEAKMQDLSDADMEIDNIAELTTEVLRGL